jgi:hypothetical protein
MDVFVFCVNEQRESKAEGVGEPRPVPCVGEF